MRAFLSGVWVLCAWTYTPGLIQAQGEIERLYWDSVTCSNEAEVRSYLEVYPQGAYVDKARECLADVKVQGTQDEPASEEKTGSSENGDTGTVVDETESVHARLKTCAGHLAAERLTTGVGGNALECYRAVLAADPGNADALAGLKEIEDTYLRWAYSAIENEEYDRAQTYLTTLRKLNPERSAVRKLATALAEEKPDAREREQVPKTGEELSTGEPRETQPDLPHLPEGTVLLSEEELRKHVVGKTLSGASGRVNEYYAENGEIKNKLPPGSSYWKQTWSIEGYELCREFFVLPDGCWLLSVNGDKVSVFDPQSGKLKFKAKLLDGNPKRL